MSHFATVEPQIRDIAALRSACTEMGFILAQKWHPTTLTRKTTGHGMFSGTGFFTREGTPAMIYHGEGSGRN